MMKTTRKVVDKREQDIKKKLSAAILMLLVSCIMVVTSTYAWFTLSTAPEVTGIQTTIGGNGNLEIALANYTVNDDTIIDNWANTTQYPVQTLTGETKISDVHARNITWGNLVDLGATKPVGDVQKNIYGLDKIVLYPAALNVKADGKVDTDKMIKVPTYGADGRVDILTDNVVSGVLNEDGSGFGTSGHGVRSIGVSSSMTKRQFAYRDAIADMSMYQNMALTNTNAAISTYGNTLANIAVKYGLDGENASFTQVEMDGLIGLINDTIAASKYIENAIIASVQGAVASKVAQEGGFADSQFELALNTIQNLKYNQLSISEDGDTVVVDLGIANVVNPTIPASAASTIVNSMRDYEAIKTALTTALGKTTSNTDKTVTYTWDEISKPLKGLMDINGDVTVAGMTVNYVKDHTQEAINTILGKITSSKKIIVNLGPGSSVLYDVAELVGSLSSKVDCTITHDKFGNLNTQVYIEASITDTPVLTVLQGGVTTAGAPAKVDDIVSMIDDSYAFALDLFFRTNASESNLLLQTNPAQRIYSDATNENTMGGGSTMTFSSVSLDTDGVKALMENIKVVFISADAGNEGKVLATAALDLTEPGGNPNYIVNNDGGITADLRLYEAGTNNLITSDETAQKIMGLTRNQAHKVTVLVYLDGETIENSDVSTAAQSMTGTMNLQFASDANLQAMNYTELNQVNNNDTKPQLATPDTLVVDGDGTLTITDTANTNVSYKVTFNNATTTHTTNTVELGKVADGSYTISVVATDTSGAKADSAAKTLNVSVANNVYTIANN